MNCRERNAVPMPVGFLRELATISSSMGGAFHTGTSESNATTAERAHTPAQTPAGELKGSPAEALPKVRPARIMPPHLPMAATSAGRGRAMRNSLRRHIERARVIDVQMEEARADAAQAHRLLAEEQRALAQERGQSAAAVLELKQRLSALEQEVGDARAYSDYDRFRRVRNLWGTRARRQEPDDSPTGDESKDSSA